MAGRVLTVDVDDCEGPEGEASPAAQLPSHQLDDLCDLVIALLQEVLAGTQEGTASCWVLPGGLGQRHLPHSWPRPGSWASPLSPSPQLQSVTSSGFYT